MNDQAKPVARLWRRRLRFSVRGLIVLVLVVGGGLGWLVRQTQIQREAVAAIRKAGASVAYSWQYNHGKPIPGGGPWAPSWLVDLVGVDYFGHATFVWLLDTTPAAIAHVARLERLEQLRLDAPLSSSFAHSDDVP